MNPILHENPNTDARISLASSSPQRVRLLTDLGFPLLKLPQDIDETLGTGDIAHEARRLSRQKAESCCNSGDHSRWILGVDTLVGIGQSILGKPSCREEAYTALNALQGNRHKVWSGITLLDTLLQRSVSTAVSTEVEFIAMSEQEINWYLDTGEWDGAAGAYRIQGRGCLFIHGLNGSYHNVVGLPIDTFYGMLRSFNYPFHVLKR